ncbi:MAG TPA: response regulator transcription factor, partial [Paludibacter sp.]
MNEYRILVVDDEEDLCEILQFNLENEGYKVDVAYSAEEALVKDIASYSLLLLDVMMGEISGFRMARMLRENPKTAKTPIIFLTAKDTENDKLTGFALGAEDYIAKPFSIREVAARIKAIFRRSEAMQPEAQSDISFENLEINLSKKKVLLNNVEIPFTKKEFEILKLFLENRNRVFSRDEILSRVWSDEDGVLNR